MLEAIIELLTAVSLIALILFDHVKYFRRHSLNRCNAGFYLDIAKRCAYPYRMLSGEPTCPTTPGKPSRNCLRQC